MQLNSYTQYTKEIQQKLRNFVNNYSALVTRLHTFIKHFELVGQSDKTELPLIFAIFYFKSLVYFYIVPSNEAKFEKYLDLKKLNDFCNKLPFFKHEIWKDLDYSNSERKSLIFNMTFEQSVQ